MKKVILPLLIILFASNYIYAQSRNIDSIYLVLQKEKNDTSRILRLNTIALAVINQNQKPDSGLRLAMDALVLSQKIKWNKGIAVSLNRIGSAYNVAGNAPKALQSFLQALRINEKINNLAGKARSLQGLGSVYKNMEDYPRSLDYTMQSLRIFQQINEKTSLATVFNTMGGNYYILGRYDSAMVYAQKSYAYGKYNLNREGPALLLMGKIYLATGETKLALECFRSSLTHYRRSGFKGGFGECYENMAKLYSKQGQTDSAIYYASKSFSIGYNFAKYTVIVDRLGSYVCQLYQKKGQTDSAFHYLALAKVAKDSITSQQKMSEFQNLGFDEKLRQIELAATEEKVAEERIHNLQYAAIAVAILGLLILFFVLSRTVIVKENFIKYFNIIALLAVFEFINLLIHPYLADFTHHSPPLMLIALIGIGALLIPLHHKLEHWVAHALTEKNKQIRLAAAKKTLASLEVKES